MKASALGWRDTKGDMYVLILIFFHYTSYGNGSSESMTTATAEFSSEQKCKNAAADLYKQKTDSYRVIWTCSPK